MFVPHLFVEWRHWMAETILAWMLNKVVICDYLSTKMKVINVITTQVNSAHWMNRHSNSGGMIVLLMHFAATTNMFCFVCLFNKIYLYQSTWFCSCLLCKINHAFPHFRSLHDVGLAYIGLYNMLARLEQPDLFYQQVHAHSWWCMVCICASHH